MLYFTPVEIVPGTLWTRDWMACRASVNMVAKRNLTLIIQLIGYHFTD
jgi:hypothetical protein